MNDTDQNAIAKIVFASGKVKKELASLPEKVRDSFLIDLQMVAAGLDPLSKIDHLTTCGPGVIELIINGSPAYRCVYSTKTPGSVVVLYAGVKTTNGTCRKLKNAVDKRLAAYKAEQ